jgi:ABC-type antimicrobial peptide transport system permease subunit
MKNKIIRMFFEAAGILFGLFGALCIVVSLMPWINPGMMKALGHPLVFNPFGFFVGLFCLCISLYCSRKAKRLAKNE